MKKIMIIGFLVTVVLTIFLVNYVATEIENAVNSYQQERADEKAKFMALCVQDEKEYKCEVLWKASN